MNVSSQTVQSPAGPTAAFASPASTSVDELVGLRAQALAIARKRRKRVRVQRTGEAVSRVLGRGLDFSEVRSYQPGDDIRMIDWNVTARTGSAHTKLFVEERERPFFLVIDFRTSMRFATRGMYKSVLAARLAALFGWSAVASNDRVGGLVFADDWHSEIKPQTGRRGLMALFRAIEQAQRRVPGSVREDVMASELKRLRRLAHGGSQVCLLSDFTGFGTTAEVPLSALQQHVELTALHISDPLERELPPAGNYPLVDGGRRFNIDSANAKKRALHSERYKNRAIHLQRLFSGGRSRYQAVSTDSPLSESASLLIGGR